MSTIVPVATLEEAKAFSAEVREAQKANDVWLADNPFVQRVATGQASREEIGEWVKQFFLVIEYLHKLAHGRPKASLQGLSPEFKQFFWENRVEEQYGAISGTQGHLELLIQLGEAVGLSRMEIVTAKPNEASKRIMAWAKEHVINADEFLDAQIVIGLLEAMNPEASSLLAKGCRKYYGLNKDQIRFFTVHITADADHGEVADQLLTLIPKERWPQIREQALEQCRLFRDMWAGVIPRQQEATGAA